MGPELLVRLVALIVVFAFAVWALQRRNGIFITLGLVVLIGLGLTFFRLEQVEEIKLPADIVFQLGSVAITNSVLATWVTMLILILLARAATGNMQLVPHGVQNFMEWIIEALRDLCVSVTGNPAKTRDFFPLVATIFLFVLTANWLGLVPGFTSLEITPPAAEAAGKAGEHAQAAHHMVPLFRPASTDLNTTLALAVVSVLMAQIWGVKYLGVNEYRNKFFTVRGGPIGTAVGLIEFISEVAKIISFSFRLFGNIFAGEVVLAVMSFLVPFGVTIPFLGLELFVGFIQAFVFAMLTLVFLVVATTGHGHDEHEHAEARH